jgi:2-C-methyl-D-erythritol 4-phosphate cytidylyltransferase
VTAQHQLRGDVAVLVPAAGLGTRLGPGQPKALRELGGQPLLVHAVRRIVAAESVGCVVIAAPVDGRDDVAAMLAPEIPHDVELVVVAGGDTRQASVAAALAATPDAYPVILVHDAARAFAPVELIERVAQAVRDGHDAVIPVLPVADTIKSVDESGFVVATVDRAPLRVVQTPQGFARPALAAAHAAASTDATDDAGLAERIGLKVFCVAGDDAAFKVTRPGDLVRAEQLLRGA